MAPRFHIGKKKLRIEAGGQRWVFRYDEITAFYLEEVRGADAMRLVAALGGVRAGHVEARLFIKSRRDEMHLAVPMSERVLKVERVLDERCPDASLADRSESAALEEFGAQPLVEGSLRTTGLIMTGLFVPLIGVMILISLLKDCQ